MIKRLTFIALTGWLGLALTVPAQACGGFFCEAIPIDQAGEQIVFHQQGNQVTALVRILYQGDAERFSWVVPVPTTPEIAIGDDATFDNLESVTRPQFDLLNVGEPCPVPLPEVALPAASPTAAPTEADGVTIEESLSVGPFDIQIVSSDNPDALATWLLDNNYDLTDRGVELITPYVNDGMKFVAVKLRSGQATGSIQPLLMRYESSTPMIPIRLTAIAAQDDMGVLTWVISDARAVPENYKHVIPNYTKLNWYAGSRNAYISYQSLITDAMNEAGGQGFATDLATRIDSALINALPDANAQRNFLASIESQSDAFFLSDLIVSTDTVAFQQKVSEVLPLRPGESTLIYFEPLALQANYTDEELANARAELREAYITMVIEPVENSTSLFTEGRYLTRLYTTLSADEMTVDPVFVYNPDMPDQALTRKATLKASCEASGTKWTLILGEGTGRDGETVINANGPIPLFAAPDEVTPQPASAVIEITSADAAPQVVKAEIFETVQVNPEATTTNPGDVSDPGESTEPGETTDPSDNTEPGDTTSPGDTTDPSDSTDPADTTETVTAQSGGDDDKFLGSISWWWLLVMCFMASSFTRRRH